MLNLEWAHPRRAPQAIELFELVNAFRKFADSDL
jgi:hypothetical protein